MTARELARELTRLSDENPDHELTVEYDNGVEFWSIITVRLSDPTGAVILCSPESGID